MFLWSLCKNVIIALVVLLIASPAEALPNHGCKKRAEAVAAFEEKFGEIPLIVGTMKEDRVMEFWVSRAGSWSVMVTDSKGLTCMRMSGENLAIVVPRERETH